jgi:cellulose biosynthesis protein BcsQ
MADNEIPISKTEVRHCGWTARVDEYGGSIFAYRPKSKGAQDHLALTNEIVAAFRKLDRRLKHVA